jgi:soluble lytic murein transglycosylase-like protein
MQVMYPTALENGYTGSPEGLFDIPTNLDVGATYLKKLLDAQGGDVMKALAAYNGGPGGIDRPAPRAYALAVWKRYKGLK